MKETNKTIFLDPSGKTLHYNSKKAPVSIPIERVLFIKGDGSYIEIYVEERVKVISVPCLLCCMEELLKGNDFIRCHNSWLVNTNKIEAFYKKEMILIVQGYEIPISRNRWDDVKWILADKDVEFVKERNPEIIDHNSSQKLPNTK
jgi:DNA-binding LytR/AlgR family response regulator